MKTNLEDISSIKKKLSIEIESEEVDKRLNEAYVRLAKNAKIPGFRPGKIPRKILEARFSSQVEEDVSRDLVNETMPGALQDTGAFPLGVPILEKEILKKGQSFKYSAVMEVRPEFELTDYLGLEVEKEKLSVSDEDIQNQLDRIREGNGKLTSISGNRPVKKDDLVVIEYEGFEEGKPMDGIKSSNFLLKVGSNEFHPAFEQALIGLKKEDTKEIPVTFEEDFRHTQMAGKNVNFKVKLIDIKEMILPELNDEFAKNLGSDIKDLDDLKKKVKESFTASEHKRIDNDLKQVILSKISDSVDFELPQTLVDNEIEYAVENVRRNLTRSGSNLEKAGLTEEKLRNDFMPASQKRVKNLLILGEIAQKDGIEVDEGDISKAFKEIAETTGQDPETLKKYYQVENLITPLKERLLEEKTLNYLVESAKIKEVDKGTQEKEKA